MAQVWKCTCGAAFPEHGFPFTRHIKEGRERGEAHGSAGLVDEGTGEVLARTLPEAVAKGFVPPSARRRRSASTSPSADGSEGASASPSAGGGEALLSQGAEEKRSAASVRGKFYTQEVMLDGRLLLLYDLARQRFPEYDASVGEWLWDVVMQFYVEHTDELGLGKLFEDSLKVEVESG